MARNLEKEVSALVVEEQEKPRCQRPQEENAEKGSALELHNSCTSDCGDNTWPGCFRILSTHYNNQLHFPTIRESKLPYLMPSFGIALSPYPPMAYNYDKWEKCH